MMDSLAAWRCSTCASDASCRCEPNEGAKKPAFKLWIDFGSLGVKQSSATNGTLHAGNA